MTNTGEIFEKEDVLTSIELKGLQGLRNLNHMASDSKSINEQKEQLQWLPVDQLMPGKYQPRIQFDESSLNELAQSIQSQGIIQPLVVRERDDKFEIIAGERRWRASKLAGLLKVPVIIRTIDDNVALAFSLIENIQRQNLNPVEEAYAYVRFKEEFNMTHEEISKTVGRSRASVTNTIRLLSLTDSVKQLLEDRNLDMGHARALLTLSEEDQETVACKVIEKQLSVRDAEKLVSKVKTGGDFSTSSVRVTAHGKKCDEWAEKLSTETSLNVLVKLNRKGIGTVTIQVDSPEEVDWLVEHLKID